MEQREYHWKQYVKNRELCDKARRDAVKKFDRGQLSPAYGLADKAQAYDNAANKHFNEYLNRS